MPDPQTQSASDATVGAFMSLDEGKQRDVLGKMSPEAKQALLTGIKTRKTQPSAGAGKLTPPPSADMAPPESTAKKLGRGALLGAAAGLGIPESTSGWDVATGAAANVGKGLYDTAKSIVYSGDDTPAQRQERTVLGPLGPTVGNMARGLEAAGGEAWKGLKDKDPEAFAHGFASAATQLLTLALAGKAGEGGIKPGMQQARLSTAISAGGEEYAALEKAMPKIVEQAQQAGVQDLPEFGKVVKKAHTAVNDQFNRSFDPIKAQRLVPMDISREIRKLVTPDMAQTAEGRAEIHKINDAAVEYQKDWSLEELNERRMNVDKKLDTHYKKSSMGQYSDPVDADIREAERRGAANIVYGKIAQANPGLDVRQLKAQHGALWKLDDAINGEGGATNDLRARQAKFKAEGGRLGSVKGGASVSGKGMPHGYFSGIADAIFNGGPLQRANSQVRRAFNPSLTSRASKLGATGIFTNKLQPPPQPDDVE